MRSYHLLALLAAAASAQTPQNYSSSLDMEIDPGSVSDATKSDWCRSQRNNCDTLCDDASSTNDCSISTLDYECLCRSNDSAPGLQFYEGTLPTFICKELFSQCIGASEGDLDIEDGCKENIDALCGRGDVADADVGGDDNDDDDNDDEDSSETSTASSPDNTSDDNEDDDEDSNDNEDDNNDDDDFGLSLTIPQGMAALAAMGVAAVLV
jgi:hypothetical protein